MLKILFYAMIVINHLISVTDYGYNKLPDMGECGAIYWLYVDIDNSDSLEQNEVWQLLQHEDCSYTLSNKFSG